MLVTDLKSVSHCLFAFCLRSCDQRHAGNRLLLLFDFLNVLPQFGDAAMWAERQQLSDVAAQFVERIKRGFPQAVRQEIPDFPIVAFDWLQSRCYAPISELVAERSRRLDRKQLAKLMASLEEGDVVVVSRLDHLARSMLDLLTTLNIITTAGAGFKSLRDTWSDTTAAHGRLLVNILGCLAKFERELIMARRRRPRTSDGEGRKDRPPGKADTASEA